MKSKRKSILQFGLGSLLMLIAIVGAWLPFLINREPIETLAAQNRMMRRDAGMLVIDDPSQAYAIAQDASGFPGSIWAIYLPPGRNYTLHFAHEGITATGFPKTPHSIDVEPREHIIRMAVAAHQPDVHLPVYEQELTFIVDDEELKLKQTLPIDYQAFTDSWVTSMQQSIALDKPFAFVRTRIHLVGAHRNNVTAPLADRQPAVGRLLWLTSEPIAKE